MMAIVYLVLVVLVFFLALILGFLARFVYVWLQEKSLPIRIRVAELRNRLGTRKKQGKEQPEKRWILRAAIFVLLWIVIGIGLWYEYKIFSAATFDIRLLYGLPVILIGLAVVLRKWKIRGLLLVGISALVVYGLASGRLNYASLDAGLNFSLISLYGLVPIFAGLKFLLSGFLIIPQEKKAIIQMLGAYYTTLDAGLRWTVPILMKKRCFVEIWQQSIRLFTEEHNIDFKGGGTAKLVEPTIWFVIEDPYKAIYEVDDWVLAIKERTENLFRDYLSNKEVEEVIDQATTHSWWILIKREHKEHIEKEKKEHPDMTITEQDPEERIREDWGIRIKNLTLSDFEWDEEVKTRRRERYEAKIGVEIERNNAKAATHKARGTRKMSGDMVKIIGQGFQKQFGVSPNEALEVADALVKHFKSADTERLVHWVSSGEGNGFAETITKALKAIGIGKTLVGKIEEKIESNPQ